MLANLAGYLGNHVTGWLRSHGSGESTCLLFLAVCYLLGGVMICFVDVKAKSITSVHTPAFQGAKS